MVTYRMLPLTFADQTEDCVLLCILHAYQCVLAACGTRAYSAKQIDVGVCSLSIRTGLI